MGEAESLSGRECQWNLNRLMPPSLSACVHDLIAAQVRRNPDAPAICSELHDYSYAELDGMSTRLAQRLHLEHVQYRIVPLWFEKSPSTVIAALAVMKAGGASLLLDILNPVDRLRNLVEQSTAPIILANHLGPLPLSAVVPADVKVVTFSEQELQRESVTSSPEIPVVVDPSRPLFVTFTSGSTGTPKGVVITHMNFASSVLNLNPARGLNFSSRVFDLTSYSFDASWSNMLHTLCAGGCVCIPTEQQFRSLDFHESIARLRANHVLMTPTVARLIDPARVPQLRTVELGGEMVKESDIVRWGPECRIFHMYGPAECTVMVAAADVSSCAPGAVPFGRLIGANAWVIDPMTNLHTAPGDTGELWIEGPVVGAGYLNDAERTSAAFIRNPEWLFSGRSKDSGHQATLYRTGDLVTYDAEGNLTYVARKDTQVKIRGQRVELREIEACIEEVLPDQIAQAAVDVVPSPNSGDQGSLAAFLVPVPPAPCDRKALSHAPLEEATCAQVDRNIRDRLPIHMVPNHMLTVPVLPATENGKMDRAELRRMGQKLLAQEASSPSASEETLSLVENELREAWAVALGQNASDISTTVSFLALGGDSIKAILASKEGRKRNVPVSVADVLGIESTIKSLAKRIPHGPSQCGTDSLLIPFSLLSPGLEVDEVRRHAAEACSVNPSMVVDIYPCTPMQEALLATSIRRRDMYVARLVVPLHKHIDAALFRAAWETAAAQTSSLRTRIISMPGEGLVQVELSSPLQWESYSSIGEFERRVSHSIRSEQSMYPGKPLTILGLIQEGDQWHFGFVQHHALYDSYSLPLLQAQMESSYLGKPLPSSRSMGYFVRYLQTLPCSGDYWCQYFSGLMAVPFPAPAPLRDARCAETMIEHRTKDMPFEGVGFLLSTLVYAAWALVSYSQTGIPDTVFGIISSGRQSPIHEIESIMGPLITSFPLRVRIDRCASVHELLADLQKDMADLLQIQHAGLQNISQASPEAKQATGFQTLLVLQPEDAPSESGPILQRDLCEMEALSDDRTGIHALTLAVQKQANTLHLKLTFDPRALNETSARRLALQMEHAFERLCRADCRQLNPTAGIDLTSDDDLCTVWHWNAKVPEPSSSCVHDMICQQAKFQPDNPAVTGFDGHLSYVELDDESTRLALELYHNGIVTVGTLVPMCFSKSIWVSVAILAVMKAGGASVLLDPAQPQDVLWRAAGYCSSSHILCGRGDIAVASTFNPFETFVVGDCSEERNSQPERCRRKCALPTVDPSAALYVIFTSGTTGLPKGIVVNHQNFTSEVNHTADALYFDNATRVADFTSYAFDVAWANLLNTLCTGGCICIPSEGDRVGDLAGFLARHRVNYLDITPSLAYSLDWTKIPKLRTLVLGGEPVGVGAKGLFDFADNIIVAYGPAETTVTATLINLKVHPAKFPTLGVGYGLVTWVVNTETDTLAPIGAIGELFLEGPLVSQGYLANEAATSSSFLCNPEWLLRGTPHHAGREGMVYRTGDLVRYEDDGKLTFIGRRDCQVKLRGQRLELSEVENRVRQVLRGMCGELVADVITPEQTQTPTLAVFVVFEPREETQVLANHAEELSGMKHAVNTALSGKVPSVMIPGAYIAIDQIPTTTSGKLDRAAIQRLGTRYTAIATPPAGSQWDEDAKSTERILCGIWTTVLGIGEHLVSPNSDFRDLGGDSIRAMSLAVYIRTRWGIKVSIGALMNSGSTLRKQAALIDQLDNGVSQDQLFDLEKEINTLIQELSARPLSGVDHSTKADNAASGLIFMTGSTGFFGIQLLRGLLTSGMYRKIVLLVRPRRSKIGLERIINAARDQGWWEYHFAQQIEVWAGDLSQEQIGLSPEQWRSLKHVEAFILNGASVDWNMGYAGLRATNVLSTAQLLRVAMQSSDVKRFIYISGGDDFDRTSDGDQMLTRTGYEQTKFVCERVIKYAAGLTRRSALERQTISQCNFSIVKPGLIVGNAADGTAKSTDFIWRLVRSAFRIGIRPYESYKSWIPIVDCAALTTTVLRIVDAGSEKISVEAIGGIDTAEFWSAIEDEVKVPLKTVTWTRWIQAATQDIQNTGERHPLWPLQPLLNRLSHEFAVGYGGCDDLSATANHMRKIVQANIKYLMAKDMMEIGQCLV